MEQNLIYIEEPLRLLIVEDNMKHLEDAKTEMQRRIEAGTKFEPFYASTLRDARAIVEEAFKSPRHIDGVITDIFYPTGIEDDRNIRFSLKEMFRSWENNYRAPRIWQEVLRWSEGTSMPPSGAYLASELRGKNVPVVLCTDGWHHGDAIQSAYSWASENEIGFVDNNKSDERLTDKKYWGEAYCKLINQIARKVVRFPKEYAEINRKMKDTHDSFVRAFCLNRDFANHNAYLFGND
jgi:hypothetical protein